MKKFLLALFILSPLFFVAQNMKKEKVKSSFLAYPKIDMNGVDAATMKAEFCSGNIKIVSQKVQKGSNACKAKGGKAQVIEIFYYTLGVMKPNSYLRIMDGSGSIKYVKQTTRLTSGTTTFGFKKCYWAEPVLKSAYEKERVKFTQKTQKEEDKAALKVAKDFLNGALTFTYVPQEVEVYYFKNKNHDYSDLEKAAEIAGEGYKDLKDNYSDKTAQSKLKQAISMWEKALAESKPDNKEAKINKKVTMVLGENLGRAYMYLHDYDNALKAVKSALDLQKNVSNNGTIRRKALLADILEHKKGYELNKDLPVNTTPVKVPITQMPKSELNAFMEDAKKYGANEVMEDVKASKEEYEKGVESGEINPYQKYVVVISGGSQLTLPDLASKITKEPAGEKLNEFPEEITGLTGLILKS
jgi:tetratricopeptide (TPR) repeat protein